MSTNPGPDAPHSSVSETVPTSLEVAVSGGGSARGAPPAPRLALGRRLDAWLDSRPWNVFSWILRWTAPRSEDFAWLLVERHARLAGIAAGSLLRISLGAVALGLGAVFLTGIWLVAGVVLAMWGIGVMVLLSSFPARMSMLLRRNRQALDVFLTPVHGADFSRAFRRLYGLGVILSLLFYVPSWALMVDSRGDWAETVVLAARIYAIAAAASWFLLGTGTGAYPGLTGFCGFVIFPILLWIGWVDSGLFGHSAGKVFLDFLIAFYGGGGTFFHLFNSRGYAERILRQTGNG